MRDLRNIRILPPLSANHPAIGMQCWICGDPLAEGSQTCLATCLTPKEAPPEDGYKTVEALLSHATCAFRPRVIYQGKSGTVSSTNEEYVFVRFDEQLSIFGWNGATAQACNPADLTLE